ncbi:hypothetical protein Tco_1238162 [Tanacetum coccineum]
MEHPISGSITIAYILGLLMGHYKSLIRSTEGSGKGRKKIKRCHDFQLGCVDGMKAWEGGWGGVVSGTILIKASGGGVVVGEEGGVVAYWCGWGGCLDVGGKQ